MKQLPYISNSDGIIGYSESSIAKSEKNDCFVRAVASSFQCPYDTAHEWVKVKFKRKNRKGTYNTIPNLEVMEMGKQRFNDRSVIQIKGIKVFDNESMKVKKTTLNQFIKKYPQGTFIIFVRRHAFTLKDGKIIGNPEDSKQMKKIINNAFQII